MITIKLNILDKKRGRTVNQLFYSDDNTEMPETSKKKVALCQPKLSATIIWRYRTV